MGGSYELDRANRIRDIHREVSADRNHGKIDALVYYIEAIDDQYQAPRTSTYRMAIESDGVCDFPPLEKDAARARSQQLQRSLELLPWVATVDAFQHWLYTHPGHDHDERREAWIGLRERFEPGLDWSGQQDWYGLEWQRQLHLYRVPFYYIEYGIAQVGALQVWLNWRNKGAPALAAWREALALGGSRPLPELFTAALPDAGMQKCETSTRSGCPGTPMRV